MVSSDLHVIVGLGDTGLSCVRFLKKIGINHLAVNDTRERPPHLAKLRQEFPDIQVVLGKLDDKLLAKASRIVLSPGIAKAHPVIAQQSAKGIPVIGDIEIFAEHVKVPVLAITGTNAKSTVTTLVGKMAEKNGFTVGVGGNLGIPILDLLSKDPEPNLYVLELSSFQLETTYSLKAHVSSVLNITPDHMDRYRDLVDYQQAKLRIYQNCHTAVMNLDDQLTQCKMPVDEQLYFTLTAPAANTFGLVSDTETSFLAFQNQTLLDVHELPILGKHYQANALAALAIGHGIHMSFANMLSVLREFKGLPHRCQFVRELDDVIWINDSKGTNVGATQAAIYGLANGIQGKMVLIAGGVGKNADFTPLLPLISQYVRHLVLIGQAANDIASVVGTRVPITMAVSIEEAILEARKQAKPKDYVLLSPACASFDMFNNFEERGNVFMEIVKSL